VRAEHIYVSFARMGNFYSVARIAYTGGITTETIMAKRELINTGNDKRYVRRDEKGRFKESDDQGRSLSGDRRQPAKRTVTSGHGDRGDQKRK
jgi:hypothetical protein